MAAGIYLNGDNCTYTVTFHKDAIRTTVTTSGDLTAEWILDTLRYHRTILRNLIVGLDVEWNPNFQSGDDNMVALIQICVGHSCLIFQILNSDFIPTLLADFLMDERFTFFGVKIKEDVDKLIKDYDLPVANMVDLRQLAAERLNCPAMRMAGLAGLVNDLMGIKMQKSKEVSLSKWDSENLTLEQIKYVCHDAFASFELGRRLFNNGTGRKRRIRIMPFFLVFLCFFVIVVGIIM